MNAPPQQGSQLATFELVFQVGPVTFKARPKRIADPNGNVQFDRWIIPIDVDTPIGKIDVHLGMSAQTFDTLVYYVKHYSIVPRLSELLEGNFGSKLDLVSIGGRPIPRRKPL